MSKNDAKQQPTREVNQDIQEFIKHRESFSDIVYLDSAGNPTIGYGHKLTLQDLKYRFGMEKAEGEEWLKELKKTAAELKKLQATAPKSKEAKDAADKLTGLMDRVSKWTMTDEDAEGQFQKDLANVARQVEDYTKGMGLTDNQFGALVSLAYNVGADEVFLITQRDAHGKKQPYDPKQKSAMYQALKDGDFETAAKLFLVFNHAGGKVDPNMDDRRNAEMNLFLKKPDKSPAQQPPNQAAGPNREPAITKQASYHGAYQESILAKLAKNPDSLSPLRNFSPERFQAFLPPAESRARAVAAAWGRNPPWAQSDEVAGDHASAGAAVGHPRFTTESQWYDYIIGMLVDMLSKPRVFYYHITIETELVVLSRFSLALTFDWSGNLLSCQRLDHGDSYCGIIGPPEKIVASQGARTFIC